MRERRAWAVVGLGLGDEGKGRVVDFLARHATEPLVCRFNGGPQAAHNVVTPGHEKHHTFAQWGSGTFVGAGTFLSHQMLVNPLNAFAEAEHLRSQGITNPFDLLYVSQRARVITPMHRALNQLRELARGDDRHGSCGQGISEVRLHEQRRFRYHEQLRVHHLYRAKVMAPLLHQFRDYAKREFEKLEWKGSWNKEEVGKAADVLFNPKFDQWMDCYQEFYNAVHVVHSFGAAAKEFEDVIFEGAQGVLLDENVGFHPHTTWSVTTTQWADELMLERSITDERWLYRKIGVTRSYTTRHGAGPFPTEDFFMSVDIPELHNGTGVWQGSWRAGPLDVNLLQYALSVCPVDYLAVTHVDRVPDAGWDVCTGYKGAYGFHATQVDDYEPEYDLWPKAGYADRISQELGVPLFMESYGPTAHETRVHERSLVEKSLPLEYA